MTDQPTTPPTDTELAAVQTAVDTYRRHPSIGFACCTAHPVADAGAMLLAEVRRLRAKTRTLGELAARRESELIARRAELAAFEMLALQQCPAGLHADWLVDSEYAHACPWCRVAELEVGLNDLAALVSQWHGRAAHAEAALADVRKIAARLAAHAVGFGDVLDESDRGPWGRTVGADIAELSAAVAPDAAPEATSAPLRPVPASSVSESAQSPTGAPEGPLRDSGPDAARIALTRSDLAALLAHHADVLAARWRAVAPGAGAWEVAAALALTSHANELSAEMERPAVAELLDNIWTFNLEQQAATTEDLASADNPTRLRWGLNDVLWSDDDSVIVLLSGPDREAYWLELDPERAAVLREDLAGPDGGQQAKARCGNDIETALGTYPCERDADHGGDCDERTEAEYAAEGSGH